MAPNRASSSIRAIGYAEACTLQQRLVAARKANAIEDVLLLCEHPHVITLGRNGKREHLLASEHVLQQKMSSSTPPTVAAISRITAPAKSSAIRS